MVHPPVTDTGWVTDAVREQVAGSPDLIHVAAPQEEVAGVSRLARLRRGRPGRRERAHPPVGEVKVKVTVGRYRTNG